MRSEPVCENSGKRAAEVANGVTQQPASRILVLMYHAVHAQPWQWEQQPAADRWYGITAKQFEGQMERVSRGFGAVLLQEFLSGRAPAKSVVLTFDDGHESNFSVAFPILQRLNLRAEFFVTASRIEQPGYMNWDQLKVLLDAGMSVQSHGLHHRPLTGLSDSELARELNDSKKLLESRLRRPVPYLSAPGGFVDKRVYAAALSAGYTAVCNSEPGLARPGRIIPRVAIMHSTSQAAFESLLQARGFALVKSAMQRKFAKAAKAVLGVERYEAVKKLGLRRTPGARE
jgi:peptidoglycan/xylan/chitin deacetylase (PgdA/CDA1 family)